MSGNYESRRNRMIAINKKKQQEKEEFETLLPAPEVKEKPAKMSRKERSLYDFEKLREKRELLRKVKEETSVLNRNRMLSIDVQFFVEANPNEPKKQANRAYQILEVDGKKYKPVTGKLVVSGPYNVMKNYTDKIYYEFEHRKELKDPRNLLVPDELFSILVQNTKIPNTYADPIFANKMQYSHYQWEIMTTSAGREFYLSQTPDKNLLQSRYAVKKFQILDHPWMNNEMPYDIMEGTKFLKEYETLSKEVGKSSKNQKNIEYLKQSYIADKCILTAFIGLHKYQIEAYHRNTREITYDYLLSGDVLNIGKDDDLTIEDLKLLYQKHRLELSIYDFNRNLVLYYHPEMDKRKVCEKYGSQHDKYIIGHNHIWLITKDLRFTKNEEFQLLKDKQDMHYNCDFAVKKESKLNANANPKKMRELIIGNSIEDIVKNQNKCAKIIYNGDMIQVYLFLREKNIVPTKISGGGAGIDEIRIKDIIISRKITGHVEVHFDNVKQYELHKELKDKLRNMLICHKYRSNYNSDLKTVLSVKRANLKCVLPGVRIPDSVEHGAKVTGIDCRRAYCTLIENMIEVPIFNESDQYKVFNNEPLERNNIYLVKVKKQTIYMSDKFIYCFGRSLMDYIELTEYNRRDFEIVGYMRPSRIEDIDLTPYLKELYSTVFDAEDKDHNDSLIKDIVNVAIGLTGKRNNTEKDVQMGTLQEMEFARTMCDSVGAIYCLNTEKDLYMFKSTKKTELVSGFYVIQAYIYDRMRYSLFEMWHDITTKCHIDVLGCNTDCLYIKKEDTAIVQKVFDHRFKINETNPLGLLGQWKLEYNKSLPKDRMHSLKSNRVDLHKTILETKVTYDVKTIRFTREEELEVDCKTMVKYITDWFKSQYNSSVQINALGPGFGKSYLLEQLRKEYAHDESLFVGPSNALIQDVMAKNQLAKTTCGLLRLYPKNGQLLTSNENRKIIANKFKFIIFDEILLNSIKVLNSIASFMKNNPNIKFACTIGGSQMKGMEKHNLVDIIDYKRQIVNKLFPTEIMLTVPKRGDCNIVNWILNSEFALKTTVADLLACVCAKFRTVATLDEIPSDFRFALCHSKVERMAFVKHMIKKHGDAFTPEYRVLTRHMGSDWKTDKKKAINVQCVHKLVKLDEQTKKAVFDEHSVDLETFNKNYILNCALTIASSQGMTVQHKYVIMGLNSVFSSRELILVALSRGISIENIIIYTGRVESEQTKLMNRIESHITADMRAKRPIDYENYITPEWIIDQFHQTKVCGLCNVLLTSDNFSVDRINNSLGHVKNNCKITCRYCNVAKSDSFIE